MFHGLVSTATRFLGTLNRSLFRERLPLLDTPEPLQAPRAYQRLQKVVLTDEVSRTLFQEFALHRDGVRGEEEIGWVLLGVRELDHAVVLATLPAGAQRSAGIAHVRFNSNAQALASRIVRQWDKRLTMLGVVHTHPGSLRHPSDGDFQGDSLWVDQLRGGEGIFGIGTAEGRQNNGLVVGRQPLPHVQELGGLMVSWYALRQGDSKYRPLQMQLTLGPDLALPLHSLWATIEFFAEALERLCRQQAGLSFQVVSGENGATLAIQIKLAEPGTALRVVLGGKDVAYFLQRGQELLSVDPPAPQLDRSVYLVLAELAGQS
jgi:hypothetical protein